MQTFRKISATRWLRGTLSCLAVGICSFAGDITVRGQAANRQAPDVEQLKADLHGPDLSRSVAAASALGTVPGDDALDALLGALQLGAPRELTIALVGAVSQHRDLRTIDLLRHFTRNRSHQIRIAAIKAVGTLPGKESANILVHSLSDSRPTVRAVAARLLGERGERSAEAALFKLLVRGDRSAAIPLGQVAGVETAKRLGELIGDVSDRSISTAYGVMLKRGDFGPDPLRVEVIQALGRIPGAESTAALFEYVASVPSKEVRPSKKIAQKILRERSR